MLSCCCCCYRWDYSFRLDSRQPSRGFVSSVRTSFFVLHTVCFVWKNVSDAEYGRMVEWWCDGLSWPQMDETRMLLMLSLIMCYPQVTAVVNVSPTPTTTCEHCRVLVEDGWADSWGSNNGWSCASYSMVFSFAFHQIDMIHRNVKEATEIRTGGAKVRGIILSHIDRAFPMLHHQENHSPSFQRNIHSYYISYNHVGTSSCGC